MAELSQLYPSAKVIGVEPSIENSAIARQKGLEVFTGKLAEFDPQEKYDLVFSNHVLQHTIDPAAFIEDHSRLLTEEGIAVLIVQDASTPSNELLYSDQNYSFLPSHLKNLANKAGMDVVDWQHAPDIEGLRYSQMLVFRKSRGESENIAQTKLGCDQSVVLETIYEKRRSYLDAWSLLDCCLLKRIASSNRIFNFGAGMYGALLACYCDQYWARVESCIVDDFNGDFLGKPVFALNDILLEKEDAVVLGIRPSLQKAFFDRLRQTEAHIVRWDDLVNA